MKRNRRIPVLATTALAAAIAIAVTAGCQGPGPRATPKHPAPIALPTPVRAVWVARFHYKTPEDVRTIIRNAAALGFNTVLWQVRGNGTVMYPSRYEPWAEEYDFRSPGFDPLALAVAEAHAHGLRIEAWVNVMPGWRGPDAPPVPNQLWNAHPAWFLHDAAGQRQPLYTLEPGSNKKSSFYVILNPCLPAVRDYISSVIGELVTNYPLDGVHLDYIRYAWDTTPNARNLYPRDRETLRLYRNETGQSPDEDAHAWDAWRINQLTRLVAQIRQTVDRRRPGATLTAAVWSSPKKGYSAFFQNAIAWLRTGLLDAAYPMAYTDNIGDFDGYIGEYRTAVDSKRIIPGLGIYKHDSPQEMAAQLDHCRKWGGDFALFSYASLHAVAGDREQSSGALQAENRKRDMRRGVLTQFVR